MIFKITSTVTLIILALVFCIRTEGSLLYIFFSLFVVLLLPTLASSRVPIFLRFTIGLFVLGFWLKPTLHGIFEYPYVEATGAFSGEEAQWSSYFVYAIIISSALLICSIWSFSVPRAQPRLAEDVIQRSSMKIFFQVSALIIILVYMLNWKFGFYRIGVGRDLYLPYGLNAPASFMVYLGAPALLAILASDSVLRKRKVTITALLVVAVISIIAAITTYSRATILVLVFPIVLGMYRKAREVNGASQSFWGLVVVMAPTSLIILGSVSVMRILVYGGAESVTSKGLELYFYESLGLFVDRWIGAEALMVSVSSAQSIDLFLKMLMEDPSVGVKSIYQELSASQYFWLDLDNMSFLTLPGAFALLTFSGSYLVVFVGVLAICVLGVCIEWVVVKLFVGQYSLQYVFLLYLAYYLSQVIFPRLLMALIVQMVLFLGILNIYYILGTRREERKRLGEVV